MARYFKGKTIDYHTTITVSNAEKIIIWIVGLLGLFLFILNMFIFESVFMVVLADFIIFLLVFGTFIFIMFSPKHEDERIENTRITK